MTFTGVLSLATSPLFHSESPLSSSSSNKVCKSTCLSCSLTQLPSSTSSSEQPNDSNTSQINNNKKFSYSRASPSVRWPHLKLSETYPSPPQTQFTPLVEDAGFSTQLSDSESESEGKEEDNGDVGFAAASSLDKNDETQLVLGRPSKTKAKKMTKLALKRAKDWRERVKFFTDRILGLKSDEFVADVLDDRKVQMTPTDFCFVVKWVGQKSWQRALEVYEWLNLRHWYAPNARMLATILAVLGKANQEALAVEIYTRAEPEIGNTVQVYNAMMGVYARSGRFKRVQELLNLMRERGCEPDLVSLNTLINARLRSGAMVPNLAIELLNEVRRSGLRPDIITYNTLISGCARESNLEEAVKVYADMEAHNCQPDLWTYNAMISVYGRCGQSSKAEQLFKELESKGFFPDAVTYNSLLYAFARELNIEKVRDIGEEMVKMGFAKDEMTYNTIIHMYGKQGKHDQAQQIYRDMKMLGRIPDAVTYTVLIDSLGKENKITEAANVMSEMLDSGVKPTLRTYSALMCGYAKAGKQVEAQETFDCMIKSGIRPDHLAYSVMLDIFLRSNETKKAMTLYQEMLHDGFMPDNALYEVMLRVLGTENKLETIEKVIRDMEKVGGMNAQVISSILVKGECYDHAAKMLRLAITSGYELDRESLFSILSSYSSCGRHSEACELLAFLKEHAPGSNQLITEAMVVIQCKAGEFNAALAEYSNSKGFHSFSRSCTMYEILIQGCEKNELFGEASQVYSDMRFYGIEPSEHLYQIMVLIYCKMGFPETAHHLIEQADMKGILFDSISIYVDVIEVYGKLKLWQKAESLVGSLKQRCKTVDRKVWNALIQAYAASGCYERARVIFNTMTRDGPSPTVESVNGLLQALIVDGRLDELYVLIQELQDMGFKISKSSILLMLEAYARAGNIFEVKKIYHGMKAAGYFPKMDSFRIMIKLLCRGKRVRDVEAMVSEMEEAGFKPDLSIWNSLLKLYAGIEDFKKTVNVYQRIKEAELQPDEDTYNTLIILYCRDRRPEEGLTLMHEMRRQGLEPKLNTYKSLISAFGKQKLLDQAEELFEELRSNGCKLDRSFYHTMMKLYRNSGNHAKAEMLLSVMKEAGIEPNFATMHLLMVSYGSSGQPQEAEKVLDNLKVTGLDLDTLPYSSVIDAYLRNGDYNTGIQKLNEMKKGGLEPDHRIWTCFIRAASLSQQTSEAFVLLNALRDAGFDLPIRLLKEKSESLIPDVDHCLENLEPLEDNAAFNFVNALEDLLWAYELRATASWVFQLAVKRGIYNHDVFRVADKDWGADFRKLSAGSALVGLTLWLDQMQDASLEGYPESPKSVVLITGTSEYNMVSLNSTLKACLWEIGSPFLPCKTRSGLLVAKAHSLRMWLKDSPFCLDLELKDAPALPESNSMQLIDGCFLRRGLVPAFKEINEKLGLVRPKKFARLALLSDEKRERVIQADIEGRKEKLEKMRKRGIVDPSRVSRIRKLRKRTYIRPSMLSNTKQIASKRRALD
ncbi:pentatricopeptide repeat-containing protein At3g18110, chloroplastic [Rosa rugosa]|uniref:pentatricopeptide repeat-containing protein At3g18110, chloroplastic n=1 Tax=Rosa rugosa TaxID=74645 RepID=UPI002B4128FC|nr:pentatricopeptide repeat-containing protein At3g18110, chloroplastic [Rosa rugosa]XP_061994431.1 pentatricopeptide repeat-containing protein At3g18110, chloroplastic [Rosa rugosa]XP_061994432.1 pentatricopeptide repeat-containing protein At3g18110, chloroplastic [Rosa rugosa]XP_061994433.1 pentatricopeptide repeat-containing protein At3g18110, chloroplastic [Rosa rugosa]XP_061994434.1 pentatricopeptide repeat-containing protein At3g18110, chloroplastic [Rosa rugosa]XP_061994435.1 pentatrico